MIAEYDEKGSTPCYRCKHLHGEQGRYVCTATVMWDERNRFAGQPADITYAPWLEEYDCHGCAGGTPKKHRGD